MSELKAIESMKEIEGEVLPILLDFGATWCGPCKAIEPLVADVAEEYAGRVAVYKVDISDAPDVAAEFGVMSVPTLVFLREGREVDRVVGTLPRRKLVEKVAALAGA